jgi:hypothetical protein
MNDSRSEQQRTDARSAYTVNWTVPAALHVAEFGRISR